MKQLQRHLRFGLVLDDIYSATTIIIRQSVKMSRPITCAGCLTVIKEKRYMKCTLCALVYDLLCANISERRFSVIKLTEEWICDACKSKQPKSDNSNTPVRGSRLEDNSIEKQINQVGSHTEHAMAQSNTNATEFPNMEIMISDIMAAVKLELSSLIPSLIKVDLESVRNDIQYFNKFKQTSLFINSNLEELQKSISMLVIEYQHLETENRSLHSTVTDLSDRLDILEQRLKENNLEDNGISEHAVNHQVG